MHSSNETYDVIEQTFNCVVIIKTCTLVIGLIGNIAACIVILCTRSFYTLTGFYLLSLSTSDLLILVTGVLYNIYLYKFLSYSKAVECIGEWIFQTSVIVSTLTVTAFTVERYLAICHPFFVQSISKKSRVKTIIITIWSISALLALLPVAQIFIEHQAENEYLKQANENIMQYMADIWAILYFFMPMSVITIMYLLIWLKLKKSSNGRQIASRDRAASRTLMMFVTIIAIFFLSWGPYHVYRLLYTHTILAKYRSLTLDENFAVFMDKWYLADLGQQTAYPLSSALNPIIYLMMSKKFREASEDLLSKISRHLVDWSLRLVGGRIKSK